MYRRALQSIRRKTEKTKSLSARQTSTDNKNLKVTSKGQNSKFQTSPKQKKQVILTVLQSFKKKIQPYQRIKTQTVKISKKTNQKSLKSKQQGRKRIVSYKSPQNEQQYEEGNKLSVVQLQFPTQGETLDDDIKNASNSNQLIFNDNDFLRQTHLNNNLSQKNITNHNVKKHQELKIKQQNINKTKLKKPNDIYSNNSRSKTASQKKKFLSSKTYAVLPKNIAMLEKNNPSIEIPTKNTQISTEGTLSKFKTDKKQKSPSNYSKKQQFKKKLLKPALDSKGIKSPLSVNLPKSKQKQAKPKKKYIEKKKNHAKIIGPKIQQQSLADTTKVPNFEELQKLRQQNQKYKMFLATSAFKVQELKRKIQENKLIRQNERGIHKFQLNNLKRQLDANKKYLGHLYSYDEPSNNSNGFIPDQIIVQIDNQSSSLHDSLQGLSKGSKKLALDDLNSEGSNKIHKSCECAAAIINSNPSSYENQEKSRLEKSDLKAVLKEIKDDILREEASLKFLSDIQKVPSLQMRLSLEDNNRANKQSHGSIQMREC